VFLLPRARRIEKCEPAPEPIASECYVTTEEQEQKRTKRQRSHTVKAELVDSIDKEEAAIASIDSLN